MTSTPAQFAAKLAKTVQEIEGINARAVKDAALVTKDIYERNLRRDIGADQRLSGRNNAKVGARFDVKGTKNPTALVRAVGPAQLVESPSDAHVIFAGRYVNERRTRVGRALGQQLDRRVDAALAFGGGFGRGGFRAQVRYIRNRQKDAGGRAKALNIGGSRGDSNGSPRAWVFHPGVRQGKRTWARSVEESVPRTVEQWRRSQRLNLAKTFTGGR